MILDEAPHYFRPQPSILGYLLQIMGLGNIARNRAFTIGIIEFIFVAFFGLGIYTLYSIATLNFKGIVAILLLCVFQAIIGKKSQTYINIIAKLMKPSRFFKKYETIYDSPDIPNEKIMFAYSPHAVYAMGTPVINSAFIMNVHENGQPLAKAIHLGSRFILNAPIHGLLLRWWGIQGVNGKNMNRLMDEGKSIALVPGGYEQATITSPKILRVFIKQRKGFIKMALKKGYKICPVLVLGEHQMYQTVDSFNSIGLFLNKFKIPGVIHYSKYGLLPDPDFQITNVIGKPLDLPMIEKPTKEQLNYWHAKYIEELLALYEKYKHLNNNLPIEIR